MTDASDSYWEAKYRQGHQQSYPWDMVVSFLLSTPSLLGKSREEIRVLELGCGTAANLWFAAREGFQVSGIDISQTAIANARDKLSKDSLPADLKVSSFSTLPFDDQCFDVVLDRCTLACGTFKQIRSAFSETARVIAPGGLFFSQGFSSEHSSAQFGTPGPRRTRRDIDGGGLDGQAQITFLTKRDIDNLYSKNWTILDLKRVEMRDEKSRNPRGTWNGA